MQGPRTADDPANVESSGYGYGDAVTVEFEQLNLAGQVYGIHRYGKKIDVQIAHPGKYNGRIITVDVADVTPRSIEVEAPAATGATAGTAIG
jgi:2,4-dienoyl-CoA reductase-like NADH-dependent reductase (Old Yellow Enzyme family)